MNRQGVTFILATHDLDDVEMLAERVIVVNRGEIVFDDALGELGEKKTVRLTTDIPLPDTLTDGVVLLNRIHESEAELEIDTERIPLKHFIRHFNECYGIRDMAIEPMPIDAVMKSYISAPLSSASAYPSNVSKCLDFKPRPF